MYWAEATDTTIIAKTGGNLIESSMYWKFHRKRWRTACFTMPVVCGCKFAMWVGCSYAVLSRSRTPKLFFWGETPRHFMHLGVNSMSFSIISSSYPGTFRFSQRSLRRTRGWRRHGRGYMNFFFWINKNTRKRCWEVVKGFREQNLKFIQRGLHC